MVGSEDSKIEEIGIASCRGLRCSGQVAAGRAGGKLVGFFERLSRRITLRRAGVLRGAPAGRPCAGMPRRVGLCGVTGAFVLYAALAPVGDLWAVETTVTQSGGGASWSLVGENSVIAGSTYTYTVTRTSGSLPTNELLGFTSSSLGEDRFGRNPSKCTATNYFCLTVKNAETYQEFSASDITVAGHRLRSTSPHTVTLKVASGTPGGTTVTLGLVDNTGTPRSGGLQITVSGSTVTTRDAATGVPTISGTAEVRATLTADTSAITDADGLTGVTYSYQWVRVDGAMETNVGSDSSTYTLVDADAGKKIKVTVSFTDDASNPEMLTSAAYPATGNVRAVGPGPPQNLTAAPGFLQVTLTWQAPQSNGGDPIRFFQYRVSADDGATWNPDWTSVSDGPDADDDAANETTVTVTGLRRGTEHAFEVRAQNGIGFSVTATAKATPTGLSIAVSNTSIAEAAGTSTVTVSPPTALATDLTVTLALSGTATETDDYTISGKSLMLGADETAVTATVTARQDRVDDDAETIIVTASHGSTTIGSVTITIIDDDDPPMLVVSSPSESIAEDGGTLHIEVGTGLGSTWSTDQTVTLALSGTATETDDYTISGKSLMLGADETAVTATVTARQDRVDDDAETIIVTASHGSTTIGSVTITIIDDDDPPMLVVSSPSESIAEDGGTLHIEVGTGLGSTWSTDQTITLALNGTATETDDYTISGKSLMLGAGETAVTATVTARQDRVDDDAETIIVTASHGSTTIGSVTITIIDDDDPPMLVVSSPSESIAEDGGTLHIEVGTGLGSTWSTDQTITLALNGTAPETDDYTISGKSLMLGAGETAVTATVTARQDRVDDDAETIIVTASHGSTTIGSVTITITDDDAAPVLSLAVSSATVDEEGGTSTVTVSTGTGSTFETDQAIALSLAGTATLGDDYTIGSTSLTLPAGMGTDSSKITTTITAADDDFFGGTTNQQITVTGSRDGANFDATRTVTIVEDEDPPKLTLTLSDGSISENGGSTTVTASVAPRTVDAFTVSFSITPTAPATAADYDLEGDARVRGAGGHAHRHREHHDQRQPGGPVRQDRLGDGHQFPGTTSAPPTR